MQPIMCAERSNHDFELNSEYLLGESKTIDIDHIEIDQHRIKDKSEYCFVLKFDL